MRSSIFALLISLTASSALANEALYKCTAQSVLELANNGTLTPPNTDHWKGYWSDFLIDTATGVLRRRGQPPERLSIIQKGSSQNDFIAAPQATLVSAATDVIRVRAWDRRPGVTFYAFHLSRAVSGMCVVAE